MRAEIIKSGYFRDTKKIRVYTVHIEGRETDEFSDFIIRMKSKLKYPKEMAELLRFVKNITDKIGYDSNHYKDEGKASKIVTPRGSWTQENSEFGLRLYCLVLTPKILILFNGDTKTAKSNDDCPHCKPHFEMADRIAAAIQNALLKDIGENEFEIETDDDYLITF